MPLIKLTAIPHPDINQGRPAPVYVDPDHVVLIYPTEPPKRMEESTERKP